MVECTQETERLLGKGKMGMIQNRKIHTLVLAALFLSMGMLLPLLTLQIKEIGDSLLPMHLAVLLCSLLCGWKYGLIVGAVLPFLRSAFFGMPPMYPNGVWMSFELAAYGCSLDLLFAYVFRRKERLLLPALLGAMLLGRIVWGSVKAVLLGLSDKPFSFAMFWTGGFVDAVPGIVLQLILIPVVWRLTRKWFAGKG